MSTPSDSPPSSILSPPSALAWAALLLGAGNLASRLLGVVREQIIAAYFGLSASSDAFTAAARVPTALYDLLVGGMISAALVPIFSDYLARGQRDELVRVCRVLLSILAVVLTAIVGLGMVGARPLMDLLAPEYPPETRAMAADLLRMMLPALWCLGLSGLLTAYHYARRRFSPPALAAGAYNLGLIIAVPLLVRFLGVHSLAIGVVLGTLFQVLVQFRGLEGVRLGFGTDWRHPGVRRIYRLYLPVAAGLVVSLLGVAIDTNLASRTGEGSMAAMRFATTLVQFPLGMIATAVSFAVLPTLARYASTGTPGQAVTAPSPADLEGYRTTLGWGIKLVLLAVVPAAVGLVVLREPVVRLLFERGAFSPADTSRTALAFLAYSPGLVAAAVDQVLIVAFYARKNTVTPVVVGVAAVGVYLATGLALLEPLGMPGLALANSAQWISHALLLLALLGWQVGGWGRLGIGCLAGKALLAAGGMAGVLLALVPLLEAALPLAGTLGLAARLALAVAAGGAAYSGGLLALRTQEVWSVVGLIKGRLRP
ncbi:MAG: murein biosynthesis integral membrane protein MurJ [Chloroflexi bacterium]|nr:murein biosynthesis integral membrane protein MurJ [Chloroflexota bacterium]